jgi:hypothetical protein
VNVTAPRILQRLPICDNEPLIDQLKQRREKKPTTRRNKGDGGAGCQKPFPSKQIERARDRERQRRREREREREREKDRERQGERDRERQRENAAHCDDSTAHLISFSEMKESKKAHPEEEGDISDQRLLTEWLAD